MMRAKTLVTMPYVKRGSTVTILETLGDKVWVLSTSGGKFWMYLDDLESLM